MSVADLKVRSAFDLVGPDVMSWKGTWSALTSYLVNDVVVSPNGESYVCVDQAGSLNENPDTAPPGIWALMSNGSATAVSISSALGAGVSVAEPTPNAFTLSSALVAGSGVSLTPSGVNANITIANTGVLSVSAGTGISVGGTSSAPIVNNTGVLSVGGTAPITIGGTATAPVVSIAYPSEQISLVSGGIPSASAAGPSSTTFITFPSLGGASQIDVVAGGVYSLQGQYTLLTTNIAGYGVNFGIENGAVDTLIVAAPNTQYDAGSPLANINVPFCALVKPTTSVLQLYIQNGATANGGDVSQISIPNLYLTRII